MKKIIVYIILLVGEMFLVSSCSEDVDYAKTFDSVLIEREDSDPQSGKSFDDYTSDLLLADPFILKDDDGYYVYGTGPKCSTGIEAYYSKDLFNWEYCGFVFLKEQAGLKGTMWAPEVYKRGNKYLIYFTDAGTGYKNTYVAQSDSPKGPFTDPKFIVSNALDPTLFIDNGDSYLFCSGSAEGTQRIYYSKLSEDMTSIIGDKKICVFPDLPWEGTIVEGPSVFKYNNHLYLAYSGQVYTSLSYSVGLSYFSLDDGSCKKMTEPILTSNGIWFGTGHCSFFYDNNSDLRIVFHAHNSINKVDPRRTYIGRIYNANGNLVVGNTFVIPHVLNN